jgi:hypothetical protein
MEHIKPQAGGFTTDPQHGHETSDVNIRAILAFGAFLVFSAVVIHVLLWGMYRMLDNLAEARNPAPNPMMQTDKEAAPKGDRIQSGTMTAETEKETVKRLTATFPEPRLQVDDVRDMNKMRQEQTQQMAEYQWANKETGTVRIPIDRAVELIAERGLPNVPAGTVPAPPAQGVNAVQPPVVKK